MPAPLVSVVMPVYAVERYVGEAVRSVLRQSLPDFELIVVDDCSPDRSMDVVASFDDPRLRILRHARNQGVAQARNTGIAMARGRHVAMLDSDDIAMPDRLAAQVTVLERNPGLIGCGGAMRCMDADGHAYGTVLRPEGDPLRIPPTLLLRNPFALSTMMFRRQALSGLRYRPEVRMAEDYEFMVRASRRGALCNLPDLLVHYRVHAQGQTATKAQAMDEWRRHIARAQLRAFGLDPGPNELDLHLLAAMPSASVTRHRLDEVHAWLHLLAEHNRATRHYAPRAFDDVLASTWFELCTVASSLGPWALGRYVRQRLPGRTRVPLARQARFAAKALLGLQRLPASGRG